MISVCTPSWVRWATSGVPKKTLARCLVMTTSCGCGLNSGRMAYLVGSPKSKSLQHVTKVPLRRMETLGETLCLVFSAAMHHVSHYTGGKEGRYGLLAWPEPGARKRPRGH